jgi:hypothetical protein
MPGFKYHQVILFASCNGLGVQPRRGERLLRAEGTRRGFAAERVGCIGFGSLPLIASACVRATLATARNTSFTVRPSGNASATSGSSNTSVVPAVARL